MFITVMTKEQIEEHFKNSLKEKGWNIDHLNVRDKVQRKVDEVMEEQKKKKCREKAARENFHRMRESLRRRDW